MGWPVYKQLLNDVLSSVDKAAIKTRSHVKTVSDASLAGDIKRQRVANLLLTLDEFLVVLQNASAVSGIVAFTRDQYRETGLDVSAEFTSMRQEAESLRDWIHTNIPRQGTAVLMDSMTSDGTLTALMFTTAALANFRTEATNFIDTIDIEAP